MIDELPTERRRYYRIRYPLKERPKLKVGKSLHGVIELSEGGLKIEAARLSQPEGTVSGLLLLADARYLPVRGRIMSRDLEEIVLCDLEGLPLAIVIEEQRRLIRKYALFDRSGDYTAHG
jgi:hypothetical protein